MTRRLLVAVAAVVVLAIAVLLGAAWLVTDTLVHPNHAPAYPLRILATSARTVTLSVNADARRPGVYGVAWRSTAGGEVGSTVVGPVLAVSGGAVTRALIAPTAGAAPLVGDPARVVTEVWLGTPRSALGLPYTDVSYPDPLGPMPAWFVPGRGRTWVIEVHGYNGDRTTGLRLMPVLHRLGYPILDITYRNDAGAPPSADHRIHLGDTEWHDLQAAVAYATSRGAARVLLTGWSMGGGIIENYLNRAPGTTVVAAAILDAPSLDWGAIIRFEGGHLPGFLVGVEEQVLRHRTGISLARIDMLVANRHRGGPAQPVLLFHGTADTVVPFATSQRFAQDWPRSVTFRSLPDTGHTQAWNVDPPAYEAEVTSWLAAHVAPLRAVTP